MSDFLRAQQVIWWSRILVDLGDDEVPPVDEGDHFSLFKSLGVCSFHQHFGPVPNLLHPHLRILEGRNLGE